MAVIDVLPGTAVIIKVEGKDLQEHAAEVESVAGLPTTACYVQSSANAAFAIVCKADRTAQFLGDYLAFHVYVDGNFIQSQRICANAARSSAERAQQICDGFQISATQKAPFRFSSLQITPDFTARACELYKTRDLGCIAVKVYHKRKGSVIKPRTFKAAPATVDSISEKIVKGRAFTHEVKYAEPIHAIGPKTTKRGVRVNPAETPDAEFVFHYRNYVIPRTPTPPPLHERQAASLNVADVTELQSQIKELKSTLAGIKREKDSAGDTRRKRARVAPPASQYEIDDEDNLQETSVVTEPAKLNAEVIELE